MSSGLTVRLALAGTFLVTVATTLALHILFGEEAYLINDSMSDAVVHVNGKEIHVAAGETGKVRLKDDRAYHVETTFADGTTSSFDVDTSRGPNYKDFRAYALAKSQCFAMIDVSPAYKRGDKFKVTDTFDHTHYLEASSKGGREFLPPGPLPETARFESTLLTLRKVPCEIVNGAKAREAFEATLNSK